LADISVLFFITLAFGFLRFSFKQILKHMHTDSPLGRANCCVLLFMKLA